MYFRLIKLLDNMWLVSHTKILHCSTFQELLIIKIFNYLIPTNKVSQTCPYVPRTISCWPSQSTSATHEHVTLSYWSDSLRTTMSSKPLVATFLRKQYWKLKQTFASKAYKISYQKRLPCFSKQLRMQMINNYYTKKNFNINLLTGVF